MCILRSNPVDPDSRVEKEAEALLEAGYSVHVFCWDRESSHQIRRGAIHQGRIPVYRFGCKAVYGGGVRSLRAYLKFQVSMSVWLYKNGGEYSFIHACDFDTAFFSYLPSRIRKCRFIFDIFDFICGDPQNLFQWAVKKAQYWLIGHADGTIICTEQRRKQIRGAKPRKLVVVHNAPDLRISRDNPPVQVEKEKISVVYVGVLQDNRLLLEMLSYFKRSPDIHFYAGGFGLLEKELRAASEQYDNIHFLGKLSYGQTLALEAQCNIMTAIYDPDIENHRFAAPNKLYESLMLGKPVLMAKGTGMSDVVEDNRIGELIDYSEKGFEEGMRKMIDRKGEWEEMSDRMKELYQEHYNWSLMSERLKGLYQDLINMA